MGDIATFTLDTRIHAPVERCFDLARSVDLHINSSHVPEKAVAGKTTGLLELGDEVTWEARHLGKVRRLTSRITAFDFPRTFSVEQIDGPFASHTHDFSFVALGPGETHMHETFQFRSPFGMVGRLVDWAVLTRYLTKFMERRNTFLKNQAEGDEARTDVSVTRSGLS